MVLFVVCGISAALLSLVNMVTTEPIAAQAEVERREAFQMVMPGADDFREQVAGTEWEALRGGKPAGTVLSVSAQGYSGRIVLAFGLDEQNRLTGLRVLSHTETPGLGAKITGRAFLAQFAGLTPEAVRLKRDDSGAGRIDAITAATISSRAVTNCVRSAVERRMKGAKP